MSEARWPELSTFLIMRARSEGNDAAMTQPLTHSRHNSSYTDLYWEIGEGGYFVITEVFFGIRIIAAFRQY